MHTSMDTNLDPLIFAAPKSHLAKASTSLPQKSIPHSHTIKQSANSLKIAHTQLGKGRGRKSNQEKLQLTSNQEKGSQAQINDLLDPKKSCNQ